MLASLRATAPRAVLLAVLLAVAPWSGRALAQDSEEERTAAARALFEEGMRLVAERDVAGAADRLRRSLDVRYSPVVAYNLSSALVELGHLVEASEHLRSILRLEEAPAAVREAAEQRLASLLPRIARLTVRLEGPPDGVVVEIDGAPLDDALVGVAQPIDPGTHAVAAMRDAAEVARASVELEDGAAREVVLAIPPPPPAQPTPEEMIAASVEAAIVRAPDPGPDVGAIVLWTGVGAAAVAAIVTAVVLATAGGPEPVPGDFEPPYVRLGE